MSKFNPFDINKSYVSPYDEFLAEFENNHELSLSQQQERTKHSRIAKLRDKSQLENASGEIWDEF